MTDAYPLAWPPGWPRTPEHKTQRAKFGTTGRSRYRVREPLTVAEAVARLQEQVGRLRATGLVISSDMPLRRDGLPMSGRRAPDDPAVAVYFTLKGTPHCLPCDNWDRLADNIAAVAAHIDAVRAQERYGVGDIARAFAGFVALPAPGTAKPYGAVLGLEPGMAYTRADIVRAYRAKARERHPDAGGSNELMAELTAARDEALRRFGA